MCNCNNQSTMDSKTPRNLPLTAFYKRSQSYRKAKIYLPATLDKIMVSLDKQQDEVEKTKSPEAARQIMSVIAAIRNLKDENKRNNKLRFILSNAPDAKLYNDYIAKVDEGKPAYFHTLWLLSECYTYRRIIEALEMTSDLQTFDPYKKLKENSFVAILPAMILIGTDVLDTLTKSVNAEVNKFTKLLMRSLWSPLCDAFLRDENERDNKPKLLELTNVDKMEANIVCNHYQTIWNAISDAKTSSDIVDIVLNNVGYELFCDMCLADYIVAQGLAGSVRFHVKSMPWFVYDATSEDFDQLVQQLNNNPQQVLSDLGSRWLGYLNNNTWSVHTSTFWTLPLDFSQMEHVDPDLYKKLAEAKLIIFKGDLNYRKLFGDKNWDPVTSIEEGLQGFHPAKLCTLRIVKTESICGLESGIAQELERIDEKWMETAKCAVIQYCGIVKEIKEIQ